MCQCVRRTSDFSSVCSSGLSRKQLKQQTELLEGQDVPEGFTVMRTSPCSLMRTSPCLSQGFAVQSASAPWLGGNADRQEQETSNNEEAITPWHCSELKRQPGSQEHKLLYVALRGEKCLTEQICLCTSQQSRLFSDFRCSQKYPPSQMHTTEEIKRRTYS